MRFDQRVADVTNIGQVNVFVVGAPKAGTTSLFSILSLSQEVCLPIVKEPNFFCPDTRQRWASQTNMDVVWRDWLSETRRGHPGKYHSALIASMTDYERLFWNCNERAVRIDFSTNYLASEKAPSLIARYNRGARIVMMLRDPVERALSHHRQDVGMGRHALSLERCLRLESEALRQGTDSPFSYIRDGSYACAFRRYSDHFAPEQILRVSFRSFAEKQPDVTAAVCGFLGIREFKVSGVVASNRAREFRWRSLRPLFHNERVRQSVRGLLPRPARELVKRLIFRHIVEKQQGDRFREFFADEDFEMLSSTDV